MTVKCLAYILSIRTPTPTAECIDIFPFRTTTSQTHKGSSRLQDLYIIPNTAVIWRLMFDTCVFLYILCLFNNADEVCCAIGTIRFFRPYIYDRVVNIVTNDM